jgi:GNAT superfamily N-acetyltransferase
LRTRVTAADRELVRGILAQTGFFEPSEIDVAIELIDDGLELGEASDYRFLFADQDDRAVGYACYGPIPLTRSSWDLYWIAVDVARQRGGVGRLLLAEVELRAAGAGCRQLFVETAGREQYRPTRAFYEARGYDRVAELPDFYSPGDAKIVYRKRLTG